MYYNFTLYFDYVYFYRFASPHKRSSFDTSTHVSTSLVQIRAKVAQSLTVGSVERGGLVSMRHLVIITLVLGAQTLGRVKPSNALRR